MKRLLLGFVLGVVVAAPPVFALRFARPPEFHEWNTNTFSQLNDVLLQVWNTVNGRYQLDRTTVDPEGVRACSVGEMLYYDTGTDQICVCANASTKAWNCANLT